MIKGHGAEPLLRQQIAFMHIYGTAVCSIGVLFHTLVKHTYSENGVA